MTERDPFLLECAKGRGQIMTCEDAERAWGDILACVSRPSVAAVPATLCHLWNRWLMALIRVRCSPAYPLSEHHVEALTQERGASSRVCHDEALGGTREPSA